MSNKPPFHIPPNPEPMVIHCANSHLTVLEHKILREIRQQFPMLPIKETKAAPWPDSDDEEGWGVWIRCPVIKPVDGKAPNLTMTRKKSEEIS